jgi:hypothetical protein
LFSGQKRQAYIEEIERLKKIPVSKKTDGCKGSLTISDIRLPLKKDFVSKMQTRHGELSLTQNIFFYLISKLKAWEKTDNLKLQESFGAWKF